MSNSTANTASSSPIQSVTQTGVEVGSADTSTATSSASNSNASIAAAPPVAKNEENKPVDSLLDAAKNEPNAPAKQPAVAAAPATAKEKDLVTDDRRELEAKKSAPKADQAEIARSDSEDKVQVHNSNAGRDLSPGANSAKMRAVGPRQVQSQSQNQMKTVPSNADLAANARAVSNLKTAGGKKFEFRDGIWYDTAYSGQGKKEVKRGTDKFLRLDAGLRNIADQIGGTVVVVWNGQAYKIK
jgi:hypothetical protein